MHTGLPDYSLQFLFNFLLRLEVKTFLGLRVHLAECAVVPGTAIGDLQDQASCLGRWPENGFNVRQADHPVQMRPFTIFLNWLNPEPVPGSDVMIITD